MSQHRYDILFAGELLPGFDAAIVTANLGKLFKASPDTLARMMNGATHVLKRDTDHDTALKYESAMARAGARAVLREITPIAATCATDAGASPAAQADAITMAPVGGELLAAHERHVVAAVEVDISHIKLVSAFGTPEEPARVPPPPAPDTSHISIAEAGADLLPDRRDAVLPPPPDTSAITLAEAGAIMAPPAKAARIEVPDTSGITLAPPGADLEQLRPKRVLLDPDISALRIEPLK